jgi:hypothetical protein
MWWWVLIWTGLVVAAVVYLGVRGWGLWGQAKELGSELLLTQQRLDEVQGQLELLGERIGSLDDLAVFTDPLAARRARDLARADGRHARQERLATSLPAWAKDVD